MKQSERKKKMKNIECNSKDNANTDNKVENNDEME